MSTPRTALPVYSAHMSAVLDRLGEIAAQARAARALFVSADSFDDGDQAHIDVNIMLASVAEAAHQLGNDVSETEFHYQLKAEYRHAG